MFIKIKIKEELDKLDRWITQFDVISIFRCPYQHHVVSTGFKAATNIYIFYFS